jgi:glycine cleavage system regulatory protein
MNTSLVITVIGPDRPGLVSRLSDVAQRFGANWEESRMASLAGQFAGMVHFEVPGEKAEALAGAFRALEEAGLQILASAAMSGDDLFKVKALLAVPAGVGNPALRQALEALANEMMVDLEAAESLPA